MAVLALALSVPAVWSQSEPWVVSPDGRTVTVVTKTLRATFRDGTLVSFEDRTGGDSLFVAR